MTVSIYRCRGQWCYAITVDGEHDSADVADELDADAPEDEARRWVAGRWPDAEIVRVADLDGDYLPCWCCGAEATTVEPDSGDPACEDCTSYATDAEGDVVCACDPRVEDHGR